MQMNTYTRFDNNGKVCENIELENTDLGNIPALAQYERRFPTGDTQYGLALIVQ